MRVNTVTDRVMDSKHPPAVQLHGSIPREVKTSSLRYTIAPQAIRARTSALNPHRISASKFMVKLAVIIAAVPIRKKSHRSTLTSFQDK